MNSNIIFIVWSSRYFRRMIVKSVYRNIFRGFFLEFFYGDFLCERSLRCTVKSPAVRLLYIRINLIKLWPAQDNVVILYINNVESALRSSYFVSRIFNLGDDIVKSIYNNIISIDCNSYTFYRCSLQAILFRKTLGDEIFIYSIIK